MKDNFKYTYIIEKITQIESEKRYQSFSDILSAISELVFREDYFSENERKIYIKFATELYNHIEKLSSNVQKKNINDIISNLQKVLRNNMLDEFIQSNSNLISCFTDEFSSYYSKPNIEYKIVENFYKLIISINQRGLGEE